MSKSTYEEYKAHAKARGFQPMNEVAFTTMLRAGINPMTSTDLDKRDLFKTAVVKYTTKLFQAGQVVSVRHLGNGLFKIRGATHMGTLEESELTSFCL